MTLGKSRACDTFLKCHSRERRLTTPPCSMFQKETHIRVSYQMALFDKARSVPESACVRKACKSAGRGRVGGGAAQEASDRCRKRRRPIRKNGLGVGVFG